MLGLSIGLDHGGVLKAIVTVDAVWLCEHISHEGGYFLRVVCIATFIKPDWYQPKIIFKFKDIRNCPIPLFNAHPSSLTAADRCLCLFYRMIRREAP